MQVTLESAADRRETVENLFQFYVHDFSEFWLTPQIEHGPDGRFPPYPPLATYWADAKAEPLLILADGQIAGFALIDGHAHSGLSCDFSMGEFFVSRLYRRGGVGRSAALAAIRARPGLWDIAVARRNLPAQAFWRGVTAACADRVEEIDQNNEHWNGLILRAAVA